MNTGSLEEDDLLLENNVNPDDIESSEPIHSPVETDSEDDDLIINTSVRALLLQQ